MKNLYILPTNKPSRLVKIYNDVNRETFTLKLDVEVNDSFKEYVNIYITSDEEIKDGEWCLLNNRLVVRYFKPPVESKSFKKIILTTDKDLIKDGVQEIDDEFLEWFVENPNCGEVEVEKYFHEVGDTYDYEIIIPKEDTEISKEEPINCPKCRTSNFKNCHSIHCPMRKKEPKQTVQEYEQQGLEKYSHELESKQEALEEAAKKWVFEINGNKWSNNDNTAGDNYGSFITGAKWQQEQNKNLYTEEELLRFAKSCFYKGFDKAEKDDANCYTAFREEISSLFEQFKNK
jgi:hypothetical protein